MAVKTVQGVAEASVKTVLGVANASVKTIMGVAMAGGGGTDPSTLANRVIDLDGDDITGIDGAAIATWADQSGNNNDFTGGTAQEPIKKTSIANGHTVARFEASSSQYGFFSDVLSGLTAGTVYVVIKINADPPGSAPPESGLWLMGTHAFATAYPFTDNNIYDGFGTDTRKSTGDPTLDLSSEFRVYAVTTASGAWTSYIDGTQHFTTGTNTVAFTTTPELGRSTGSSFYLDGDIAYFCLFSVAHNSTTVGDVTTFLKAKYV